MRVLSVDLGTSNTVAVLSAHGRAPSVLELDGSVTMPSAVFAEPDGTLVVGRDAVRRARTDPARFEPNPKRRIDEGTLLLGDRVLTVTEALAAVLGRVNHEVIRQLGGAPPDEVRLTHPAQWGPLRRNALLSAARQAGMPHNLMLIPEPVAAAAHFASYPGQFLPPGKALVVYDLGAGTFDVGIVAVQQQGFAVLAEAGLPDVGGLDVDHALLTHIGRMVAGRDPVAWHRLLRPESAQDRRAARLLWEDVRSAKEVLSRHPQTEVALPAPFGDALVTRPELEAAIRQKLAESVHLMATTMTSAGLTPANLAGVYLVGGSSRIPLVATLISEQLRLVPTSLDAPETAVALGAHLLPRPGATMRTDAVAPPPQTPRPQASQPLPVPPAPQWHPQPPRPEPRKNKRLVLLALLAVLVLAGGATTYVVLKNSGSTPAATYKYDPAKLPTCYEMTTPLPQARPKDPGDTDLPSARSVTCTFLDQEPFGPDDRPAESAMVSFTAFKDDGNTKATKIARAAYDNSVTRAGAAAKPLGLAAVQESHVTANGPGAAQVGLLDDNLIISIDYSYKPTATKSAADSLTAAKSVLQKVFAVAQSG